MGLSPQEAISSLNRDIQGLQLKIKRIKHDLVRFREIKHLKAWLKDYRIDDTFGDFDDWPGFGFKRCQPWRAKRGLVVPDRRRARA